MWPILLLAAVLSLAHAIATPALWPVDETSHLAYADQLSRTVSLPRIDTPIPPDLDYPGLNQRLQWEQRKLRLGRQDIWTSNHPPLASVIQGVGLRLGRAVGGGGTVALLLARLTSVMWMVLGVWATMKLAFLLAPAVGRDRRRMTPVELAYAVGTLVAVTPTLSHLGGLVFNDVPAFALSTMCLYLGARAVFGSLTRRRLAVMGVVAGAAALTRVSAIPAVGVMALLVVYAWWRDDGRYPVTTLLRPVGVWVLALLPAAAFYVRNAVLYGSPTASATLLDKFNRDLNDPVSSLLVDKVFWLRLWNRMIGDLTTGHWTVASRTRFSEGVLLIVAVGACWWLCKGVAAATRRLRAGQDSTASSPSIRGRVVNAVKVHPQRVTWTLCSLLPLSLLATTIQFHAAGGSVHGRYVLGGYAVVATAMVVWLAGLPRIGRMLATAVPVPIFIINAALIQAILRHHPLAWERSDIELILPQLFGSPSLRLASSGAAVAGVLLAIILMSHVRRRSGHQPEADTVPAVPTPATPVRESASL